MKILRRILSFYLPIAPQRLVYMLQQVEYEWRPFLRWCSHLPNLITVINRGKLVYTKKTQLLLAFAYGSYIATILLALFFGIRTPLLFASLILVPLFVIVLLCVVALFGALGLRVVRRGLLGQAQQQLAESSSTKIAVLGSYGKTTMKELLGTVLSEAKLVKSTPGNMNVPISHARWITTKLTGSEDVIVFEYGEGKSGDIAAFAKLTSPDYAVLTGVAPNHLDQYPNYQALKDDLAAIANYVEGPKLIVNAQAAAEVRLADVTAYSDASVGAWDISDVKLDYTGTSFTILKGEQRIECRSKLIGRHQVGPLAAAAYVALELGLSPDQVRAGLARTEPFEHRMQPRQLHGAWIIDDTYNGNLEGIRAGLALLEDLRATRKVYVTPGLVDQGAETQRVHEEIGKLIAGANPDKVVLMQNSVTEYIQSGIAIGAYEGEILVETNPKEFYLNLEHLVASGDLYLLQNDWPDQYA